MKSLFRLLLIVIMLCGIHFEASAQSANDLIKQGVELHNQGKYAEAIDKFNEVLKADPQNPYANYEMAFSLYALKKPKEAIPHIEVAVKSNNNGLNVAAYCLLASIYDEDNQHQKAVDTYKEGIRINPDYPQIYCNLGITYFRNQQYAEAETSAIEAIKHNPKNASSQRLYALVTFHQNKRVNALEGFCSFLLLEPTSPRAAEAYGNIQHILQGGVLKDNNGNTVIPVSSADNKENGTLNLAISMAATAGQSKKLTGTDLLEYELKTIFGITGELAAKKSDKNFFDQFFAAYFYKLSQSSYMPAFVHTVTLTDTKQDNAKWVQDNVQQITGLADWIKTTERSF